MSESDITEDYIDRYSRELDERVAQELELPVDQRSIFSIHAKNYTALETNIALWWERYRHKNEECIEVVLTVGEAEFLNRVMRLHRNDLSVYQEEKKEEGMIRLAKDARAVKKFANGIIDTLQTPEDRAIERANEPDLMDDLDDEI